MNKQSKEKRQQLKQMYKEMKPTMGAFMIKNTQNSKAFMDVSKDLKSSFNRHCFQLKAGAHPVKELQKEWNQFGQQAFVFEVLEQLEYDEKIEKDDYSEELEIMKMIWLEKLGKKKSIRLYGVNN
jgi:hypothetical protein